MKGYNQLTLNQETVCEAVKNYLNGEVFQEDVEVTEITKEQYTDKFIVTVKPKGWAPAIEGEACQP